WPFEYDRCLPVGGATRHEIVVLEGGSNCACAVGSTWIVLDTGASDLRHASGAVHGPVIVPPQAFGVALNVEGSDVPLMLHSPVSPFVKLIVLEEGSPPQATSMLPGAVITGSAAGSTVIVLDTEASDLPQASVAVHVSVIVPPHAFGVALNVEGSDVPLMLHSPVSPFVKLIVLEEGSPPQATSMLPGAVITGSAAGSTVIVLDTEASDLPQASVAVHVSVIVPPHAFGVALNVDGSDVPLM